MGRASSSTYTALDITCADAGHGPQAINRAALQGERPEVLPALIAWRRDARRVAISAISLLLGWLPPVRLATLIWSLRGRPEPIPTVRR